MPYVDENTWQQTPDSALGGFGRYELVDPDPVQWATAITQPRIVPGKADSIACAFSGGCLGEGPSAGETAAVGVGSLLFYGASLLILGGVVIWVVNSVRKGKAKKG